MKSKLVDIWEGFEMQMTRAAFSELIDRYNATNDYIRGLPSETMWYVDDIRASLRTQWMQNAVIRGMEKRVR